MNIAFQDICVNLGGQEILSGVSLMAAHGKMTGIIGANGCGKSTLIKTLFGIAPLKFGTIYLDHTDASTLSRSAIARKVGYVGQDIPCVFDFSVYNVVEMALYGRTGVTRAMRHEVIMDALEQMHMADFAQRSILTLSGGERKLVFIARALAQGVDTIILDEPTNHLDIRHQLFIMDTLKNSARTVLIVIHDLRLAAHYCDYVYLMKSGMNLADGAPLATLTPQNVESAFGIHGYAHATDLDGLDFHLRFGGNG